MTTPDDFDGDRLLSGSMGPDDAPPQLKELVGLIRVARAPVAGGPPAADQAFVAAIADEVRRSAQLGKAPASHYLRHLRRVPSTRVAAVTAALMLTGGFAAAAATGSFPAPVQHAISHGFARVGISLPDPQIPNPTGRGRATTPTNATGAVGSAKSRVVAGTFSACQAYLHSAHATNPGSRGSAGSTLVTGHLATIASSYHEGVRAYCEELVHPKGQAVQGAPKPRHSAPSTHAPTTSGPSRSEAKTRPSGTARRGASHDNAQAPGAIAADHRSARRVNTAGASNSRGMRRVLPPSPASHVNRDSTTTSSPPANGASGVIPTSARASKSGGRRASATQRN